SGEDIDLWGDIGVNAVDTTLDHSRQRIRRIASRLLSRESQRQREGEDRCRWDLHILRQWKAGGFLVILGAGFALRNRSRRELTRSLPLGGALADARLHSKH